MMNPVANQYGRICRTLGILCHLLVAVSLAMQAVALLGLCVVIFVPGITLVPPHCWSAFLNCSTIEIATFTTIVFVLAFSVLKLLVDLGRSFVTRQADRSSTVTLYCCAATASLVVSALMLGFSTTVGAVPKSLIEVLTGQNSIVAMALILALLFGEKLAGVLAFALRLLKESLRRR